VQAGPASIVVPAVKCFKTELGGGPEPVSFLSLPPAADGRALKEAVESAGGESSEIARQTDGIHSLLGRESNPQVPATQDLEVATEANLVEESPAQANLPPTSFIEKYSHMFADEPAGELPVADSRQLAANEPDSPPLTMGALRSDRSGDTSSHRENEESVEQYMAKLLQRVRGSVPVAAVSVGDDVGEPPIDVVAALPDAPLNTAETPEESDLESSDEEAEVAVNWNALARRAAAPVSNMGALRDLANESARRAISHHHLRKHRRNAVSKAIFSVLAGIGGLWMMLDAPNWQHLQFLGACILLIAAVYWAGEAVRAMLGSFWTATHDGPKGRYGGIDPYYETELPIDVEAAT
jgi:hypothetical protein